MKRWSRALLLVVAALSFVLPVAAQTTTTDTENQSGTALVLRGQAFIQQLIGQYGANARVVDVARSLLSQLGAQYQRALTQADRDQVAKDIAAREALRATLVSDIAKVDTAIAALDPLAANYATLLADLQTTRAGKVAAVASVDAALAGLAGQLAALDVALAALPPPLAPYMQQNLNDWAAELASKISPASQAATLGDFAGAAGILINDFHVVAVPGNWGAGFAASQTVGGNAFLYATNSGQLTDEGMSRTPNRDYSYTMAGGLITVNVQVTTHYYGFMAIPPRQNSCRPDRIHESGGDDERTRWPDTERHSRIERWRGCCRRRTRRSMMLRVNWGWGCDAGTVAQRSVG